MTEPASDTPGWGGTTALRPALFLDRDGVINIDTGYTWRRDDLAFTPTAVAGIGLANASGWLVIVATNQSGVARGLYDLADVDRFHAEMQARLAAEGAHVDAFYVCPYHPDGTVAAFRRDHEDRKPRPGMILRALRDWPIDPARSVMIGDRARDVAAAEAAGIAGLQVPTDRCDLHASVIAWRDRIARDGTTETDIGGR